MSKNKFYITTSIAYTNAEPHIGYALELIQADVLARYHRLKGEETWFLTGTDEHGIKIARAAEANHKDPKEFVDELALKFEALPAALNVTNDDFIRTTDQTRHWPAAQKLWEILQANGDLYKKDYEGLYCVGHEAFIKKSELVDGKCPIHKTEPEVVKEQNWFLKISKYKDEIKKRITSDELQILPIARKNEILNLLADTEDVSVSRSAKSLAWGIPVPGDPDQTMYVWVDALSNYISVLGWAHDGENFKKFWPADIHLIGKDIFRFHAILWPTMLLSAGIELPKAIYVHGFITANGEKMSKSLGNVVDPFDVVKKYGADVVRYFLLREIPSDQDGDFSEEKLIARYNGDLANGLGNLVRRVATVIEKNFGNQLEFDPIVIKESKEQDIIKLINDDSVYHESFRNFQLHKALEEIWKKISVLDRFINQTEPWRLEKTDSELLESMHILIFGIQKIWMLLTPFMPNLAMKINLIFGFNPFGAVPSLDKKRDILVMGKFKLPIEIGEQLFPRL